jgi:hypothetical protein
MVVAPMSSQSAIWIRNANQKLRCWKLTKAWLSFMFRISLESIRTFISSSIKLFIKTQQSYLQRLTHEIVMFRTSRVNYCFLGNTYNTHSYLNYRGTIFFRCNAQIWSYLINMNETATRTSLTFTKIYNYKHKKLWAASLEYRRALQRLME